MSINESAPQISAIRAMILIAICVAGPLSPVSCARSFALSVKLIKTMEVNWQLRNYLNSLSHRIWFFKSSAVTELSKRNKRRRNTLIVSTVERTIPQCSSAAACY